jgi:hypothetical protein
LLSLSWSPPLFWGMPAAVAELLGVGDDAAADEVLEVADAAGAGATWLLVVLDEPGPEPPQPAATRARAAIATANRFLVVLVAVWFTVVSSRADCCSLTPSRGSSPRSVPVVRRRAPAGISSRSRGRWRW